VVKTDPTRGLIMISGAVPGAKGGWVLLRDAVKRRLPEAAPKPGAFKAPAGGVKAPKAETVQGAEAAAAEAGGQA